MSGGKSSSTHPIFCASMICLFHLWRESESCFVVGTRDGFRIFRLQFREAFVRESCWSFLHCRDAVPHQSCGHRGTCVLHHSAGE
ncbi:hypothetical protein MLD38_007191 [Melastoma candidum]|uniref:Uncharacterized protein n=1 Tax=Melastoma candidum TaxID=119954 RepID=A0ACB9RQV3_9MYRT|nr:hypothetical protein MLD38_007191 [Melastoma candidum]